MAKQKTMRTAKPRRESARPTVAKTDLLQARLRELARGLERQLVRLRGVTLAKADRRVRREQAADPATATLAEVSQVVMDLGLGLEALTEAVELRSQLVGLRWDFALFDVRADKAAGDPDRIKALGRALVKEAGQMLRAEVAA